MSNLGDSYILPDGIRYSGEKKDGIPYGQGSTVYIDGTKYFGGYMNGWPQGQGTMVYPDGRVYYGSHKDGLFHGQGTMTYPDGRKYIGEHRNGLSHGQGIMIYPDGRKYVGEHREGLAHGIGTFFGPDGSVLVGEWKEGLYCGPVPADKADLSVKKDFSLPKGEGSATYVPQVSLDSLKETAAASSTAAASPFSDAVKNILNQDTASLIDKLGNITSTETVNAAQPSAAGGDTPRVWPEEKREPGTGASIAESKAGDNKSDIVTAAEKPPTVNPEVKRYLEEQKGYTDSSRKDSASEPAAEKSISERVLGSFKPFAKSSSENGKSSWKTTGFPHEQGTVNDPGKGNYIGEHKDGVPHGHGTMIFPSGDRYVGYFKDGLPNGRGTYIWPNGDKHVGEWKDGLRHGPGTYTFADGTVQTGTWAYDEFEGE